MNMKWPFVLLAFPSVLHAQGIATGGARGLSLEEAIRLAHQNSPVTVQARGQIQASEAAIRSVYGTFLPSVNLSFGSNRQGGETFFQGELIPFRGDPWNFSRGVNSNLEVFDAGRRLNNLRTAKANLTTAEANERLQRFRIALEVKQQYFNIQAGRESRGAALAQLAQAEQQAKSANAKLAAGAATKSDSLRSIIQVGNGQLAVLTSENSITLASANLTRLVGTTFPVTAADSVGLEVSPVLVDAAELARWIDDAPALASAKSAVTASGSAVRASRAPYWPSLNLGLNYSGSRTDDAFRPSGGPYASSHALRFTLSYPLFNGFVREENVTRAHLAENNALAELRDIRLTIQQSVTQYLGLLRLAEARIGIQVASVVAGEEDLRVQNQRYALGSSTLLDVLTSQSTLNQSRYSLIQARYDARVAKAQLEALIGRDLR